MRTPSYSVVKRLTIVQLSFTRRLGNIKVGCCSVSATAVHDADRQCPLLASRPSEADFPVSARLANNGASGFLLRLLKTGQAANQQIGYHAADPVFGLSASRSDPIADAGLAISTPIFRKLLWAVVQYDFTRVNSNYPAYRFGDHYATLGIRWIL